MKKTELLLAFFICCSMSQASAQASFQARDSVNINNINASVMVHGDMFWNPSTSLPACEFPKGSGKHISFAGSLWMSGYDAGNVLHIAAQTYRQDGNDYWPGPLDASDTLTYAAAQDWAKIWKVNRTDILYFLSLGIHTTTNTPPSILTWPAKGNMYAQGNGGAILSITTDMAPFVDLNHNGAYEPLSGEYPNIKGDQALWWVFSDNGPTHSQTYGRPLGVEIHAMAYAYNRGTLIDNVVYYEYTIINKSPNNYHNFRVAQWNDVDLGYYMDDYVGFDSSWRMSISYNGTNDDGGGAGHPANSYGLNPPQSAITMIVLPGDANGNYVPVGSFMVYPVSGNSLNDTQCNYHMRAKLETGASVASRLSSGTLPCGGYDPLATVNYLYTGDPSDVTGWSECRCNNNPADRRFVLSSNDFPLNSGSSQKIVLALLVADSSGGCGATNFDKIKIVADTAWGNYFRYATEVKNVPLVNTLNIYPNPAQDKLFLEGVSNTGNETIAIYNTLGQEMPFVINRKWPKWEMDIRQLPAGIYNVLYRNDNGQTNARFVKE